MAWSGTAAARRGPGVRAAARARVAAFAIVVLAVACGRKPLDADAGIRDADVGDAARDASSDSAVLDAADVARDAAPVDAGAPFDASGWENDAPPSSVLAFSPRHAQLSLPIVSTPCASVAFGDLDGDGWPELLAPDTRGLRVFWNEAGAFGLPTTHVVATPVSKQCSLALGDLDGDGNQDVLMSLDEVHGFAALFGDGNRGFSVVEVADPGPESDSSFCIGTLRGQGAGKVVTLCRSRDGATNVVDPAACEGNITCGIPECRTPVPTARTTAFAVEGRAFTRLVGDGAEIVGNALGLGISDFDEDGAADAILALDFAEQVAVRGGATRADVSAAWGVAHFGHGMGVALGDVDEDGRDDVAITSFGGVIDLRGSPSGFVRACGETPFSSYRRNSWPWSALYEDVDADGDLDLVVLNALASDSRVSLGQWIYESPLAPDGGFLASLFLLERGRLVSVGQLPYAAVVAGRRGAMNFAVADVDGDGRLEYVFALPQQWDPSRYDLIFGVLTGFPTRAGVTVRFLAEPPVPGTRVRIRCGTVEHVRTLYGAEGGGAAARTEAHLGCATGPGYDALVVERPGRQDVVLPAGSFGTHVDVGP